MKSRSMNGAANLREMKRTAKPRYNCKICHRFKFIGLIHRRILRRDDPLLCHRGPPHSRFDREVLLRTKRQVHLQIMEDARGSHLAVVRRHYHNTNPSLEFHSQIPIRHSTSPLRYWTMSVLFALHLWKRESYQRQINCHS